MKQIIIATLSTLIALTLGFVAMSGKAPASATAKIEAETPAELIYAQPTQETLKVLPSMTVVANIEEGGAEPSLDDASLETQGLKKEPVSTQASDRAGASAKRIISMPYYTFGGHRGKTE